MKNLTLLFWLVLPLLLLSCASQARSEQPTNNLTEGAVPSVLASDTFPILNWDLPEWSIPQFAKENALLNFKECGFNIAAFLRPQHLQEAERLKLRCMLAPEKFPTPWSTMSDQQIDQAVQQLVNEAHDSPSVVGFFLADEPGVQDFAGLGKAMAAVKRFAPKKLAYASLFPNYATLGAPNISQLGTATYTEYLEKYISQVHPEFISYDNYQIQYSQDQKNRDVAASYYLNLLEVRRVAMEHGLPFWVVCASAQITGEFPPPSPADLSMQAYTALAAGANGMTWYTYFSTANPGYYYAPVKPDGSRNATWAYLKMVNRQIETIGKILRPCKSVGVYFTAPLPAPKLSGLPGKWIKSVDCASPLMIGEFAGPDAHKYALVVNLNLQETRKLTIQATSPDQTMQVISPVDGSLGPLDPNQSYWLPAGQGVLVKFH